MIQTEKNIIRSDAETMVTTNISFWRFIVRGTKKPFRATRAEAFYNIIEKQSLSATNGNGSFFRISTQELSKKWGWDLVTIRKFLDALEEFGVISIRVTNNSKSIRLNCLK